MEMGGSCLFQAGTRYPDSVRGSPGAYATETRTKCCREGRRMVSVRWEGGSVRTGPDGKQIIENEGPPCRRALAMPASRPHVLASHGNGARHFEDPKSIRSRSRSQASWTCSEVACPGGRRWRRACSAAWTDHFSHHLQAALVPQADQHDRCRPRGDQPRERQPPSSTVPCSA